MRCVFTGVAGFLGRIHSATRCSFWVDEPTEHDFDPSRLIEVDLGRTPSAALDERIRWTEIEVDDCFSGPSANVLGTTLGPQWPEMQIVGMVWLEDGFVRRLPEALRPPCPPTGAEGRDYEFKTAVYWSGTSDARAGRRYQGQHHGQILDERGGLARVAVFPPGSSLREGVKPALMWLDLGAADQCDAGTDSLTQIGIGDRPKEGAIFLALNSLLPSD